ncbi:ABC transporter ATP-binding protein [Actinopolymorpha pittospori]|uniref:Peptide/nickel transport system ATP-binding protein n=1 Tax=Actinopolymorpha pittospori TaxID=648752 RepID=A0A927MZ97_9ACTN|nr:ABC transporter ATP-binding protein [Actinopolymorpha pittospori]MBE1609311.1 peptide/nickel transport system ATP-binding protein [Actinopolymorpha pittospori]
MTAEVLLELEDLRTHFFLKEGVVRSVDGVSLTVPAGKTVCVVGESGCGKSVTARSILGLVDPPGRVVDGKIWWRRTADPERRDRRGRGVPADQNGDGRIDLSTLGPRSDTLRDIRGNDIAMVFQEPMASMSPMYTVAQHIVEAIRLHRRVSRSQAREEAVELLRRVGIPRPEVRLDAYPFQMSGGMCQRVMIAIALACNPRLLIADEPTTALDVTTQARILELLRRLQADNGMAMLFITHDLGVVAEIADEVVVMYLGTVVEQGPVDDIFHRPRHPYTKALLASIPAMGRGSRQRMASIRGQVPHPLNRPSGCPFHPRCDSAIPGLCDVKDPAFVTVDSTRVRCVLHDPESMASANAGASGGPGHLGVEVSGPP